MRWKKATASGEHTGNGDGARTASLGFPDLALARFGPLVRRGLKFRRRFDDAKRAIGPVPFEWYRYDSFPNLF